MKSQEWKKKLIITLYTEEKNEDDDDEETASFIKIDSESEGHETPQNKEPPQDLDLNKFDFKVLDNNTITITDRQTKRSFSARSTPRPMEIRQQRPLSHTASSNIIDDHGKVIMETEIKLSKDTAVMMRIFETPAESFENEDVEFELDIDGLDEDTQKEVNVNIIKPVGDGEEEDASDNDSLRTPKRVTFGGEVVKMRTPDSDTNNSDNAASTASSTQGDTQFSAILSERLMQTAQKSALDRPLQIQIPDQPAIITIPPTSSSESPESPKQVQQQVPQRRNSIAVVEKIHTFSPRNNAKEVQMIHNLARSPTVSPTKSSPRGSPSRSSPQRQQKVVDSTDNTDSSTPENQNITWEDLGIISQNSLRNLKSAVSWT